MGGWKIGNWDFGIIYLLIWIFERLIMFFSMVFFWWISCLLLVESWMIFCRLFELIEVLGIRLG